jgi:hypothetical protein
LSDDLVLLNLQTICNDWTIHQFNRKLASDMLSSGQSYFSTGAVFYAMPNWVVADLYDMVENFEDEYSEWLVNKDLQSVSRVKNLTLLTFLLARGEGYLELSADTLREGLPNLVTLIRLESKARKGSTMKPNYAQYSLFDADRHKPALVTGVSKDNDDKRNNDKGDSINV